MLAMMMHSSIGGHRSTRVRFLEAYGDIRNARSERTGRLGGTGAMRRDTAASDRRWSGLLVGVADVANLVGDLVDLQRDRVDRNAEDQNQPPEPTL